MPGTAEPLPEAPSARPTPLDPPAPLDPPMTPFAIAGLVAWGLATLAVLPFRHEHESWLWICVAGFLWGIPGLAFMLRHDARRRRAGTGRRLTNRSTGSA